MKISKSELKKIIKEEVGNAIDEGLMDMFKKKSGFGSKVVEKWGLPAAGGGGQMMDPASPTEIAQTIAKAIASPQAIDAAWKKAIAGKNMYQTDQMALVSAMDSGMGPAHRRGFEKHLQQWARGAPNEPLPVPEPPTTTAEQPYLPQGQYYLYYDEGEKKWRDPREDPKWAELIQQEVKKAFEEATERYKDDYEAAVAKRQAWLKNAQQRYSYGKHPDQAERFVARNQNRRYK